MQRGQNRNCPIRPADCWQAEPNRDPNAGGAPAFRTQPKAAGRGQCVKSPPESRGQCTKPSPEARGTPTGGARRRRGGRRRRLC